MIYRYEGDLGDKKECPGCLGQGSLAANSCLQCVKCNGKGQVYEYDDDLGQRYQCPLCRNIGYTIERYLECPKCKGGGRIYPFQEEKLGVPKGCIPCNAVGYIKERDYYNINFDQNNYYYNKPIDPRMIGQYIIHGATQGQFNPLDSSMVWQKMPTEEEYSVGENDIYGEDLNRQRGYTQFTYPQQFSAYNYGNSYNNYNNNNYNNDYNNNNNYNNNDYYNQNNQPSEQPFHRGISSSSNIYFNQNDNNNYNQPQVQAPGGYPTFDNNQNSQSGYYNNNYNAGYY